jgi:hypothetical protein
VQKNKEGYYGVFFMSENLGRGTDFPSSIEIEKNGGIYLLFGNVFDSIISEQIKGRVGRLNNKGKV